MSNAEGCRAAVVQTMPVPRARAQRQAVEPKPSPGKARPDQRFVVFPLPALNLVASVAMEKNTGSAGGDVSLSFRVGKEHPDRVIASRNPLADLEIIADTVQRSHDSGEDGPNLRVPGVPLATVSLDPVVQRLASALEVAEHDEGAHAPLLRDALKLAIAARLSGLSSSDAAPAPNTKGALLKWRLRKVNAYVDANLAAPLTLSDLARSCGLSRMHFAAQFLAATGMRPHDFVLRRRIERACDLLLESQLPVVQIALAVGFQTQSHFTTVFKRFTGDTPHHWRTLHSARS